MSVNDAHQDENSLVWGTVPASDGGSSPTVALIAHMDTSPEAPTDNVNPQVVEAYMNHLDWGVFWLLITGGLYAILQALVLRAEGHLLFEPAALSLGMVVFSQEMELSAVLVGVLQKFLMLAAILWFAQRYMGLRASCSDDSTEVR